MNTKNMNRRNFLKYFGIGSLLACVPKVFSKTYGRGKPIVTKLNYGDPLTKLKNAYFHYKEIYNKEPEVLCMNLEFFEIYKELCVPKYRDTTWCSDDFAMFTFNGIPINVFPHMKKQFNFGFHRKYAYYNDGTYELIS